MTVIAWDGKTLAADKRASIENTHCTVTKIRRLSDGSLVGISGHGQRGEGLAQWIEDGAHQADFPKANDCDDYAVVLHVSRCQKTGKVLVREYARVPWAVTREDAFTAIGCARDFAIATMHLGFDARKAVEVASLYDTACGNGIDALALDT